MRTYTLSGRDTPQDTALRTAWLLAMKTNRFNIAGRLRWGFASPSAAAMQGISPIQYKAIRATLSKLVAVYKRIGGNPRELQGAILMGAEPKRGITGLETGGQVPLGPLQVIASVLELLVSVLDKILPADQAEGGYEGDYSEY